eukprot:scaffold25813_cov56-Attheya_sp.AAC.2
MLIVDFYRSAIGAPYTTNLIYGLKGLPLLLFYQQLGVSVEIPGYAQAGLICRSAIIQTSPSGTEQRFSVVRITAKHNLRQVRGLHPFLLAKLKTQFRILLGKLLFWGLDISIGALIDRPADPLSAAVLFSEESKPRHGTIGGAAEPDVSISETQIEAIYGSPNTVNIYTGEITYVGEKHIEYNFNAFTGCSGAVVFLLDKNQPSSVQQCDYGKAIAIHLGLILSLSAGTLKRDYKNICRMFVVGPPSIAGVPGGAGGWVTGAAADGAWPVGVPRVVTTILLLAAICWVPAV